MRDNNILLLATFVTGALVIIAKNMLTLYIKKNT